MKHGTEHTRIERPAAGAATDGLPGAVRAGIVRVDASAIAVVAGRIDGLADRLAAAYQTRASALRVPPAGRDEVSVAVAAAVTDAGAGVGHAVARTVADLRRVAARLRSHTADIADVDVAAVRGIADAFV